MFIAIAMICSAEPVVSCDMYLWPESFASEQLCDDFSSTQLGLETQIGTIVHVGCFNLEDLDSEA
jgi:hypothetical protein